MNLLEKSISFGFGLFAYSKDKVEEVIDELVKRGEIAKKDAQEFAAEMIKKGEAQREEVKNIVRSEVSEAMGRMNIARRDDIVSREEIAEIIREQVLQVLDAQGITKKENS